ncbi:hypothetical protein PF011_g22756 [Phytophthora fragariae]|uniref:Kazal-like domain-containing protein n=1 Tax=Phytophthora fragariae TaxID=53985 RepID=A0A6A3IIX7_9STRA|nr:hypothetical protein PF011_g22756 [Phytophthora fragariae]
MRVAALLWFAYGVASATEDGILGDRTPATAPLEIGVGQEAAALIDCSKTLDCELVPYDPVCGSDDVTYANECAFASTFCSGERNADTLFIQDIGECPSMPDDTKDQEEVPVISEIQDGAGYHAGDEAKSNAEASTEVDLMTIFCSLTCKLSPDEVCGTDGVTYINDCHLLASKCEHPELEKASHGECAAIELHVLEVDESTTTSDLTPAPEKCNPMCERVYDPICGSDGITYANLCLLEYAECRNPSIKPFGAGKCPPHMQAARSASHPTTNNNGGESCIPGPCPYTYAPVCGSDGQTHDNLCLFANARCQHPLNALTVAHDGECDAETKLTCETMTCSTFTECREQIELDDTIVAYCADVCSPDRCSEREDCELVESDCYTAPCSPIAMCIPKVQDE